jgi:methionyl-tRNA synthetase
VYAANVAAWARVQPAAALEATWQLVREANTYLEANEPWKLDPGPQVDAVLGDALEVLCIVALLAGPAIPATSEEVWRRIGLPGSPLGLALRDVVGWGGYPGGLEVSKGAPLFPRLQR